MLKHLLRRTLPADLYSRTTSITPTSTPIRPARRSSAGLSDPLERFKEVEGRPSTGDRLVPEDGGNERVAEGADADRMASIVELEDLDAYHGVIVHPSASSATRARDVLSTGTRR